MLRTDGVGGRAVDPPICVSHRVSTQSVQLARVAYPFQTLVEPVKPKL